MRPPYTHCMMLCGNSRRVTGKGLRLVVPRISLIQAASSLTCGYHPSFISLLSRYASFDSNSPGSRIGQGIISSGAADDG